MADNLVISSLAERIRAGTAGPKVMGKGRSMCAVAPAVTMSRSVYAPSCSDARRRLQFDTPVSESLLGDALYETLEREALDRLAQP